MVNLGSPNYMKLIIDGDRALTVTLIHDLAAALELSELETQYFEALVLSQQANGERESRYYKNRIKLLKADRPRSVGRSKVPKALSNWYFPAVYLALNHQEVDTAVTFAANSLSLKPQVIEEVLNELRKLDLVEIRDGRYHIRYDHLILKDSKASNLIHKNFLESQIKLSLDAFKKQYSSGGKFFCHTFSISKESYDRYVEQVRELLSDITRQCQDEPTESFVQLNVQLFSLDGIGK